MSQPDDRTNEPDERNDDIDVVAHSDDDADLSPGCTINHSNES